MLGLIIGKSFEGWRHTHGGGLLRISPSNTLTTGTVSANHGQMNGEKINK